MKLRTLLSWVLRLVAALILLQTLFFKFTGAEESVYIFSQLGIEPWGRIVTGIAELITSILLLVPRTAYLGAIGAIALMIGAIASHLTVLGIEVQGDGGYLFFLGLVVLLAAIGMLYLHWGYLLKAPQQVKLILSMKEN
jgi:uncharacterized membrane protein YphA (DoxX/SURF4 family)